MRNLKIEYQSLMNKLNKNGKISDPWSRRVDKKYALYKKKHKKQF